MSSLVNPANAHGKDAYTAELTGILAEGVCPFCRPHATRFLNETIAQEGSWFAVRNKYPYEHTLHHILIVQENHIETLDGLNGNQMGELLILLNRLCEELRIDGGAFAVRFGNTKMTGATVAHLHGHLIVPTMKDESHAEPVWFPIG